MNIYLIRHTAVDVPKGGRVTGKDTRIGVKLQLSAVDIKILKFHYGLPP